MSKYYVYVYLDPSKPGKYTYNGLCSFLYEPFYVGKGHADRWHHHIKEVTVWKLRKDWTRHSHTSNMSRSGDKNPMKGKSAIKGRKWVTFSDGKCKLLSEDQIKTLQDNFTYGRKVEKNKRKRIIIKGHSNAVYKSKYEIDNLPEGTMYQFGILWKSNKKTYQVRRN